MNSYQKFISYFHIFNILLYFWKEITKTINALCTFYIHMYTKKSLFKFQMESQFSSSIEHRWHNARKGEGNEAIKKLGTNVIFYQEWLTDGETISRENCFILFPSYDTNGQ